MSDKKDQLRNLVLKFIKTELGYNLETLEKIHVFCENSEVYTVIYGQDAMAGIMGLGQSVEEAFNDFVRSWSDLNGFEWINNNK